MVSPREREVSGLVSIREAAQYQLPRNHGRSDWHRSQRQRSCAVLSGEGGAGDRGGCTWQREPRAKAKRWEQAWGVTRCREGCR